MNLNLIFRAIFLSLGLYASLENSWSQAQEPPLLIQDIKKSSATDKDKVVKITTATPDVKIYIDDKPENGKIGSGIDVNNQLTIEKFLSVGLDFQNENQFGEFVFLTHSLGQNQQAQYDGAKYEVVKNGEKPEEIDIIILQGSAIIKTSEGDPFEVIAGKLRSVMGHKSTTSVMFSVSADTGMIFLEQGSPGALVFPDHDTFPDSVRKTMTREGQIKQGDIVFFRGDTVTRHTDIFELSKGAVATAAIAVALISNGKYYDKLFSKKPFWQQAKYYIPILLIPPFVLDPPGEPDLPGPPRLPRDP